MASEANRAAFGDVLRLLRREGTRLNNAEHFDFAKPFYARALEIALAVHGPDHDETHDCLNAVALCDYNRCDYAQALVHYERLLGWMIRRSGREDELYRITQDNVRRCQLLASARVRNVAEIVFCSHFADEAEYARFVREHNVTVSQGDRLDPEGSFVTVGRPIPNYPSSVEHMPGGVETPGTDEVWTLQTIWTDTSGRRRVQRRYLDGSIGIHIDTD